MLRIRVIKKFHDQKGILIGYTIQDETGKTMDVYKEQLKNAVINKQVECVNMTLTSDGRLIGRACSKPTNQRVGSGVKLLELYTNGKKIACAMVQSNKFDSVSGLPAGVSFEVGFEAENNIKKGFYDNVSVVDGKPDLSSVKRKSFKNVRPKMMKLLADNGIKPDISVAKMEKKYEYMIQVGNYDDGLADDESTLLQIVHSLIYDALITEKVKPIYIDAHAFMVKSDTGINDVRKAVKTIK